MKIIELLNKIANGEELPDKIKWGCHDFEWVIYEYKAINEVGEPTLFDYLSQCPHMLDHEIITFNEIEEKKIPEKIEQKEIEISMAIGEQICANKINEIIDYLNSKGDK